jgi:hypothetical protein
VGHALELGDLGVSATEDLVLEAPDGQRTALDPAQRRIPLPLAQPGFYRVRPLHGRGAVLPIAVALDPAESDLAPLDRDAFLAAAAAPPGGGTPAGSPLLGREERERRQRLWWYLALGALAALAAESVLTAVRPRRATA